MPWSLAACHPSALSSGHQNPKALDIGKERRDRKRRLWTVPLLVSPGQQVPSGLLPLCAHEYSRPWRYRMRGQDVPLLSQLPALHLRNNLLYWRLQLRGPAPTSSGSIALPPNLHTTSQCDGLPVSPCGGPIPHFLCWPQHGRGGCRDSGPRSHLPSPPPGSCFLPLVQLLL